MNIIVGGGTGLIGQSLIPELIKSGYTVYVVGRSKEKIHNTFQKTVIAITWDELDTLHPEEFLAVINLAGEGIADQNWTPQTKKLLLESRLKPTERLINWGANGTNKKPHLYNASAIGIYGLEQRVADISAACTEKTNTQDAEHHSFSSQLVHQWEQSALNARQINMPVTLMRFGVVLKRGEGMLKKLELPAQWGLGAIIGSGKQPLAWIDHQDLVHAILFLIAHPEITGCVNMVAPELVSQKEFTCTLAKIFKKPAFLRLPAFVVKIIFGQMGEELLLSGQTVIPKRLQELSFTFQYPTLLAALTKEFNDRSTAPN